MCSTKTEVHYPALHPLDGFSIIRAVKSKRMSQYGALKDKISYMAPDFDEPLEDFAEYM